MRAGEAGEVDAWVLLLFLLSFQILAWQIWVKAGRALEEAYAGLDQTEGGDFEALGQTWEAPAPRIDYGAHYQKEKDAEALCFIVRCCLSEDESRLYRCD